MWDFQEFDSAVCRVGWLGSIQRYHDLARLKDSVKRLYADPELKGKFRFVQVGGEETDVDVFKGPDFEYYPGVDAHEYGRYYQKVDICLAPLKENMYNHCKSELKMVEAGLTKKAFIGQNYGIYPEHIINEVNGYCVYSDDEWYTRIKALILDKPLRKQLGEQLHIDMMAKFSQEAVAQQRIDFYKKIVYEKVV